MNVFLDILLALLAAAGLLALGWVIFGRLFAPVGGKAGGLIYAVVPACGDGETLEHDVGGLLWLRGGDLARFTIVIADAGLSQQGRAITTILLARSPGLVVCPIEQLSRYIAS